MDQGQCVLQLGEEEGEGRGGEGRGGNETSSNGSNLEQKLGLLRMAGSLSCM